MSGRVPDQNHFTQQETRRDTVIIRTSVVGIMANILLAAFKAIAGLASNSIAIVMDAVNNISDAASSVITIIGTKLARKAPDKKHPFGHGRVEYLTAMVISLIVVYAGITAFIESVKKILHPVEPDYSILSLILVSVAVVVKLLLGRYVKRVGIQVNSDSLKDSGEDATLDAVISASTLAAAAIYLIFHVSLEAWLGAVIAVIIVKSGTDMLRDTLSHILGEGVDPELARQIKDTICRFPEISGAYDLVLHNYGPEDYNGSVHIEVPDTLTAEEVDQLTRRVTSEVYQKHKVILTAISVYSINTKNPAAIEARNKVSEIVLSHENTLEMHGFNINFEQRRMRFDIVISFDEKDRWALYEHITEDVQAQYPDYELQVTMDTDFTEQ